MLLFPKSNIFIFINKLNEFTNYFAEVIPSIILLLIESYYS